MSEQEAGTVRGVIDRADSRWRDAAAYRVALDLAAEWFAASHPDPLGYLRGRGLAEAEARRFLALLRG